MAKRTYALNTGVGLFVDDETELKMVPGMEMVLDEATAGYKTQIAIRNKALIEVEGKSKTAEKTGTNAKTEDVKKAEENSQK